MNKKAWLPVAVVAGTWVSAQATILLNEQFDGTGKAFTTDSASSGGDEWVDFSNRFGASTIAPAVEGYTTASTGESVLAGGASVGQNDPQIRSDFAVSLTDITKVVIRLRADVNKDGVFNDVLTEGNTDFFFGNLQYLNPGAGNTANAGNRNFATDAVFDGGTITVEANGWHIFTYVVSGSPLGSLNSLRIDPINNTNPVSFEVDYLKIEGIPEPATLGMVTLFGGGMLWIRRRLMI